MKETTILIADRDEHTLQALSSRLREEGYKVDTCREGKKAWHLIQTRQPHLILAELELPGMNGMDLLEGIRQHLPDTAVILTTAQGSIRNAVQAMKLGATDYLTKPVNLREVVKQASSLLDGAAMTPPHAGAPSGDGRGFAPSETVVGTSASMREIFELVPRVARSGSNILITGETGTGKELVARAIHRAGYSPQAPLVTIDCAAIPENLLESELFGYARGAFTSADRSKAGQIEQAHGGTLFLDEIGEMPLFLQKKMLRFLQEKAFVRVGDTRLRRVDLRIIAATNKDLEAEISRGAWREDLYYRLDVIRIDVPPLRRRKEDIPSLVEAFLEKYAPRCNTAVRGVSQEAMDLLTGYDWPGNVRELENVIERAVVLACGDAVTPSCLPERLTADKSGNTEGAGANGCNLPEMERALLQQALRRTQGNQSAAARELGISRKRLRTKMGRHGMLNNSSA
ncbi:MAG: sigma-54 dependent transcriptional regulator [Desulfohalobiaceae bacterium]|nr:sigma-54 dependent transcriptional regulator [Desulfohalobiaceae bacterium]